MSEREYRLDVCPECKVREEDGSEKKLYQCQYCERWFCERHLGLKVVHIPDYNEIIKDVAWRDIVERDRKREDGHPDLAYTVERLNEFKIEREITWAKIDAALKKSRAYRKIAPEEPKVIEGLVACPKCGSTRTMTTAYRQEFEAFECLSCHYAWKEGEGTESEINREPVSREKEKKLSFVKEEIPYRLIPVQPKTRSHKVRNVILVVSLWTVLLIVLALFSGLIKFNIGTPLAKQWQTPSTQELKTWLEQDNTNSLTPNDISNRTFFADTLASRARVKNWKMGTVYVRGYEVNFNVAFDHVFNAIITKEGLVYVTPEFDTIWSNINHEKIEVGGTYSFGMGGFFYGHVEEVRTLLNY